MRTSKGLIKRANLTTHSGKNQAMTWYVLASKFCNNSIIGRRDRVMVGDIELYRDNP
ncbi:hypothetical protein PILCRDRAFT_810699 [Piloderma croceum F 1598]|uniref:Uncharacterized protein n=1 Tax=Piloderma croceum (strain F 1598) TaxID=765440 RepID=A0A0C3GLG4_PILCF|nr:hypothetical protein PILCRDRAFT_810699 [Piloderma croceum F 1598]